MSPRILARPDEWAINSNLKVDGRKFNLQGREYIIPVMRDVSRKMVVKKAAQTSFTICFLTRTFHWITIRGWHHLYLLPLKTGAIPFVQKRIDPMIESNEELVRHFKSVDNRTHKQTVDNTSLLIRGTNVESELQETPADVIVFDEFDRMMPDFLEDAKHRTDGSNVKRLTYLSTPSVPGHGVDSEDQWYASDQHKWEIPCPGCGRYQTLDFEHVKLADTVYDCVLECEFCSRPFKNEERADLNKDGRWVATNLSGNFKGYHINQFNSPTMTLVDIMEGWFKGQRDAKVLKSFFNQSLGEPYSSLGDQLTAELLNSCRGRNPQHHRGGHFQGPLYIGIDVGHEDLYVRADYLDRFGNRILWNIWYFKDEPGQDAWQKLDQKILSRIPTWQAVCDAHPDKRGARALSVRYPGRFWLGFEMDRPNTGEIAAWSPVKYGEATKVTIDRTLAFDTTVHEYMNGEVTLPWDAELLGEVMPRRPYNGFYYQMIQQVRVEEENTKGIIVASWKKNKNADHWHHADMFCKIATLRAPSLIIPGNISRAIRGSSLVGA